MKVCKDCRRNMQRYRDKELSGQELSDFQDHLERCMVCQQQLAETEEVSRLLHRSRPLYRVPDSLCSGILRVLAAAVVEPAPVFPPERTKS